ncbi:MAG: thiamine ABC transporter ATPase [Osedax symbiont Rs2]|nr:MAG: thiamine ABC transporter ATPase [Osedax symbiont Rs2]
MLDIQQLHIQLGDNQLRYQQQISSGDIVTLQGVSGVGKSSLLLCIAGFIQPVSGQICWAGKPISSLPIEQRPVAMLFQENNLFEHISVLKNVRLGTANIDDSQIFAAAKELQIAEQMQKMPQQLSGGQRQRVGLLRTLLRPEPLILLDEPFAELDNQTRTIAANWVNKVARAQHKTVLLVTHQMEDVDILADRNWLLS